MSIATQYNQPIPARSPEDTWYAPIDVSGGKRANYPIVTHLQQWGLFHEVSTDWYGGDSGIWQAGGHGPYAWADRPTYNGEVWTVQVTARPGYYVTPGQMYGEAVTEARWDPTDVDPSNWSAYGAAPYG